RRLKNRADEYMPRPLDVQKLLAAVARLSGSGEETPLVLEEEATVSGDPDLDLIDAAFDDSPEPPPARAAPSPQPAAPEEDFSGLGDGEGPTMVQLAPAPAAEPELPELSASDLIAPDEDAQARAFAAEVQAAQRELGEEEPAPTGEPGALDEVSRLRSELYAAEQLVGDLRDQHAQAEQREAELRADAARRDGQLKALQGRLDQTVQ